MWDFQLFSVLSRYIVLDTVTGTDGKGFFSLNFIACIHLPSWANIKMCIHLPFIALYMTTLGHDAIFANLLFLNGGRPMHFKSLLLI